MFEQTFKNIEEILWKEDVCSTELDYVEQRSWLLRLKFHDSLADAVVDLGQPEEIGQVISGFQKYLYQQRVAV